MEDQKRSIRFERESPNPIWWFEYTDKAVDHTPENCGHWVFWRETPDVDVVAIGETPSPGEPLFTLNEFKLYPDWFLRPRMPKWHKENGLLKIEMKMLTKANFPNYAITLWGLPEEFRRNPDPSRIKTNAKEFVIAKNTDDEYHLVLVFDLTPDFVLEVTLLSP